MTTAEFIVQFVLEDEADDDEEDWRVPDWAIRIGDKLYTGDTYADAVIEAFNCGAFPEYDPNDPETFDKFWLNFEDVLRRHGAKIVMQPGYPSFVGPDMVRRNLPPRKRRLGDEP